MVGQQIANLWGYLTLVSSILTPTACGRLAELG